MKLSSQFRWLSHLHCMEIPSQGRHFPGIHGPKTVKSSSKHFVNRPGHGVFFVGKGCTPQAKLKLQVRPLKSYKKGPNKESTVCSLRWFLRHQRNAQTPTVETWNIPWEFSRNSAANRSISCDACADALPVQSRFNEESGLQKEFDESHTKLQTCHGTSKVYHKVFPLLLLMVPKNPANQVRLVGYLIISRFFFYILCGARVLPSTVVVNGVKTLLISGRGEGVEHLGHVDRDQRIKKVRSCCHHSKKKGGAKKHSTITITRRKSR